MARARGKANTPPVLLDMLRRRQEMEGFKRNFERVACIMTGRAVRIYWGDPRTLRLPGGGGIPSKTAGWTDGKDIWLNQNAFFNSLEAAEKALDSDVRLQEVVLGHKGVVYHESSHVLFTPRMDSDFIKKLSQLANQTNFMWVAFNILEDQRIETLFTARYSSVGDLFQLMVFDWVLGLTDVGTYGDEVVTEHEELMYISVCHRLYMDETFLDVLRNKFLKTHGDKKTDHLESIVGEYAKLPLSDSSNHDRAIELVKEFAEFLKELAPPVTYTQDATDSGHGSGVLIKLGEVDDDDTGDSQTAMSIAGEDAETDGDSDSDQDTSEAAPDDQGGDGDQDAQNADEDDTEASSDVSGDAGSAFEDSASKNGSPGAGAGIGKHIDNDADNGNGTVRSIAIDLRDELQQEDGSLSNAAQNDIGQAKAYVRKMSPTMLDRAPSYKEHVTFDMVSQVRGSKRSMSKLRAELEEHWVQELPVGRLDIDTAMRKTHDPADLDYFEEWKPSQLERAGLEAVVLIDLSDSMGFVQDAAGVKLIDHASRTVWIINRLMNEVNQPCTVIGYSDSASLLTKKTDRIDSQMFDRFKSSGGTDPTEAIVEGLRILDHSRKPNKALIVVTDGEWYQPQRSETLIIGSDRSILTALFGLERAVSRFGAHGCRFARDVADSNDVARFMRDLVLTLANQVRRR